MFNSVMTVQYITALSVFALMNVATWYVLDVKLWYLKPFDYRPFTCRKCFTLWANSALGVGAALEGYFVFAATLITVAVLNAVAMHVDENAKYGDE